MATIKKQIEHLNTAADYLLQAISHLKASNWFDQLGSSYGAETYEETIMNLIKGIENWIKENKTTKIRIDFKHEKELINK